MVATTRHRVETVVAGIDVVWSWRTLVWSLAVIKPVVCVIVSSVGIILIVIQLVVAKLSTVTLTQPAQLGISSLAP